MNADISGERFKEKQDICIASKYLLQNITVEVVKYVHKFFEIPPSRKQSLILLPLSMG